MSVQQQYRRPRVNNQRINHSFLPVLLTSSPLSPPNQATIPVLLTSSSFFRRVGCNRSWKSLNSYAHGPLDTDLYARHIPVGRVCAERTSRAPLTETEPGNMYAGSFVFAPGPCAYGGEPRNSKHIVDPKTNRKITLGQAIQWSPI